MFVIIGGANGIGQSVVRALYSAGAHVVIGDIDEAGCKALVDRLESEIKSSSSLSYVRVDVRNYNDNLELFKIAYETHGRVDHAFSIAGVTEKPPNWFDPELNVDSLQLPPTTTIVDVNLTGVLYFTRVASVYLRFGNEDRKQDKSICIMGSVASFKEQGGLFVYQTTKHGVLGLIRSTRKFFQKNHGIRINTVCPSLTRTNMADTPGSILHIWEELGVAPNKPEEIADFVLTLASIPESPYVGEMTGLAVFVEAGQGWEIEKDLDKYDSLWLSEEMSKNAAKIEEALASGLAWVG